MTAHTTSESREKRAPGWKTDLPRRAQRELRMRASFSALLVLLFLSIIAPAWLWIELPAWGTMNTSAALSLLVCTYCAVRLARLAYLGEPQLLAVTFYVFVYVWGGISAFAQNYAGAFPWIMRHSESDTLYGVLQIGLALVAYDFGRSIARARDGFNRSVRIDVSPRVVVAISLAAVPLLVVGMLLLGGPDVLFTTRGAFVASAANAGSKMTKLVGSSLIRAPAFVAFMLVSMVCFRHWREMNRRRKRLFASLLALNAFVFFVGNFPLSLPRNWLGTVVLSPLFLLLPWRRWQVGALCVGLVALLLFVFPYSDAFRRQSEFSLDAIQSALKTKVVNNVLYKGDYDVYQQTLNALVVCEERGFSFGANIAGAALFWFPRSLWPDKPYGTGQMIGFYLGYPKHQTNLSAPLWVEAYWAFGWTGVFALLFGHGYVSGALDRRFVFSRRTGDRDAAITVAVPFLAAYQFMLVRGDLLNGVAQAAPVVILFLLVARLRWDTPARPADAHAPLRGIGPKTSAPPNLP